MVGSCISNSTCGVWQNCQRGLCVTPSKICPNNCTGSANGNCTFIEKNTDVILTECLADNEDCKAVCSCNINFSGSSCGLTQENMLSRRDMKDILISGLSTVIEKEDITRIVLQEQINILQMVAVNNDELSYKSIYKISRLARQIVESASSLDDVTSDDVIGVASVRKYVGFMSYLMFRFRGLSISL